MHVAHVSKPPSPRNSTCHDLEVFSAEAIAVRRAGRGVSGPSSFVDFSFLGLHQDRAAMADDMKAVVDLYDCSKSTRLDPPRRDSGIGMNESGCIASQQGVAEC